MNSQASLDFELNLREDMLREQCLLKWLILLYGWNVLISFCRPFWLMVNLRMMLLLFNNMLYSIINLFLMLRMFSRMLGLLMFWMSFQIWFLLLRMKLLLFCLWMMKFVLLYLPWIRTIPLVWMVFLEFFYHKTWHVIDGNVIFVVKY